MVESDGHRMGFADIALKEIIEGKLSYELVEPPAIR
jgi:DNA-directed RNA polymerase subunit K/omega